MQDVEDLFGRELDMIVERSLDKSHLSGELLALSMTNDRPPDWARRRKKTLERDGYECQNCGRGKSHNLEVHHVVPIKKGGSNKISNLQTLCKDCHKAIHGSKPAPTAGSSATPTQPLVRCPDCGGFLGGPKDADMKFCEECYIWWVYSGTWEEMVCPECNERGEITWGEQARLGRCRNCDFELKM